MAEEKNLAQARTVFETICRTLEQHQWQYRKDEEKLTIECGAQGEDLPMELTIKVDAERMLTMLVSHLPYVIQEDKRLDIAVAVSLINYALVDGCFDYDVASGHLFFRMTSSFVESTISEEVFTYMLFCSCQTIDQFNDQILLLSKGMMSMEQFMASFSK